LNNETETLYKSPLFSFFGVYLKGIFVSRENDSTFSSFKRDIYIQGK